MIADATEAVAPTIYYGWSFAVLPFLYLAARSVLAAFTAEETTNKRCADQVGRVREVASTTELWPSIAAIVVLVQPMVTWSRRSYRAGEPGDPALDVVRSLSSQYLVFSEPLQRLETSASKVIEAAAVQRLLVASTVRRGIAMGLSIVPTLYFAARLIVPQFFESELLRDPLDVVAAIFLGFAWGWSLCEWSIENTAMHNLMLLVKQLRPIPSGATS